jgi:hypothetical protein
MLKVTLRPKEILMAKIIIIIIKIISRTLVIQGHSDCHVHI